MRSAWKPQRRRRAISLHLLLLRLRSFFALISISSPMGFRFFFSYLSKNDLVKVFFDGDLYHASQCVRFTRYSPFDVVLNFRSNGQKKHSESTIAWLGWEKTPNQTKPKFVPRIGKPEANPNKNRFFFRPKQKSVNGVIGKIYILRFHYWSMHF